MSIQIVGRVTKQVLQAWIEANRPDLALGQDGDNKGFYRRDLGMAHGFRSVGKTWREVAWRLEAQKCPEPKQY